MKLFGNREYEAISADCMQVFRHMDVGTAKPSSAETAALPHHLIDIRSPDETYSAGAFLRDALVAMDTIQEQGHKCLVLGGTGLYLKTLVHGFFQGPPRDEALRRELRLREEQNPGCLYTMLQQQDRESADRLHPADLIRIIRALEVVHLTGHGISELQRTGTRAPRLSLCIVGLTRDREELGCRIAARVENMFHNGLLEETRALQEMGYGREHAALKGIGYRHCLDVLEGKLDLDQAKAVCIADTKTFARRQMTLFKRIPGLVWFHADDMQGVKEHICNDQEFRCLDYGGRIGHPLLAP